MLSLGETGFWVSSTSLPYTFIGDLVPEYFLCTRHYPTGSQWFFVTSVSIPIILSGSRRPGKP